MSPLVIAAAFAHGPSFGALDVSVSRADADELWVLTDGWGLTHTRDGGESWEWLCEEALGSLTLYDVLAIEPGVAVVAAREGLYRVADTCTAEPVPGAPVDTFVPALAPYGDGWLALVISEAQGGIWRCDPTGCEASELVAPELFPKSALADGTRVWATVVYADTLVSELWRSDDGQAWTRVYTWPDADTDPRLLYAQGADLLVWRRTRSEADTPELLRSEDSGETWTSVFSNGWYTDSAPALLPLDGALLLGTVSGARTWRSEDIGATWSEVSADVPAVRCADAVAGVGWACGDHLQDGFDLSRTEDGHTWVPVACLEEALPAACADDACGAQLASWQVAGSYGGGECDTIVTPPGEADDPPPCGCGGGSGAGALVLAALAFRRRYNPNSR